MKTIKIFRYLDDPDCFVVSDEYQRIADQPGLNESAAQPGEHHEPTEPMCCPGYGQRMFRSNRR